MNVRKCYEEIGREKTLSDFQKKISRKTYETVTKNDDSLLANLGKYQTRIRITYEIVTCLLRTKMWRFYENSEKFC